MFSGLPINSTEQYTFSGSLNNSAVQYMFSGLPINSTEQYMFSGSLNNSAVQYIFSGSLSTVLNSTCLVDR